MKKNQSMTMHFNSIDIQNEESLNPYSSESNKSVTLEQNLIDD